MKRLAISCFSLLLIANTCHADPIQSSKKKINIKEFIAAMTIQTDFLTIKIFHFNFIQVNTYVLHDETQEAIIIDPGNSNAEEDSLLNDYIENNHLKVKYIINTHTHIDHILGNQYCVDQYHAPLMIHEEGIDIYRNAHAYGVAFGIDNEKFPEPTRFLKEGDVIKYGNQELAVIYTPGHANGSICLIDKQNNNVMVGDVLFEGSVGRSDLPTGNSEILIHNIKEKLMTLPDQMTVYCGHGESTTIGNEKNNNPYIK